MAWTEAEAGVFAGLKWAEIMRQLAKDPEVRRGFRIFLGMAGDSAGFDVPTPWPRRAPPAPSMEQASKRRPAAGSTGAGKRRTAAHSSSKAAGAATKPTTPPTTPPPTPLSRAQRRLERSIAHNALRDARRAAVVATPTTAPEHPATDAEGAPAPPLAAPNDASPSSHSMLNVEGALAPPAVAAPTGESSAPDPGARGDKRRAERSPAGSSAPAGQRLATPRRLEMGNNETPPPSATPPPPAAAAAAAATAAASAAAAEVPWFGG